MKELEPEPTLEDAMAFLKSIDTTLSLNIDQLKETLILMGDQFEKIATNMEFNSRKQSIIEFEAVKKDLEQRFSL